MIQAKFNASASEQRDADHLEKSGTICARSTGMGPVPSKYSLVTEAVMDDVGRSTASVVGAATMATDSTFNMLISIEQPVFVAPAPALTPSQGPVKRKNCCCDCHTEVERLMAKQLKLQIQYLKFKLKRTGDTTFEQ
ncbi:uncharacterized protein LOC128215312 [Mya arenaria]|uniref:uncharacterized protein LOC128215312 n=1 Tax=Mya arenaria TaxID=6604 RepID=UPI0022E1C762|nr:uncharacterized protein LOC128215312 [Mya arenaria]